MPLENLLMGSLFTTMEVFFTAGISYLHRNFPTEVPDHFHQQESDPLRGYSYPIMFALGAFVATPAVQYVLPAVQQSAGALASYVVFGLGVLATEYLCGKIDDTLGKKWFAPWREVYDYLEQRVKETFPSTKELPLTIGKKSVFLPLLPVWCAVGAFLDYVHHLVSKG